MLTRRLTRATLGTLVATAAAAGLTGCLSNPEPAPLVVATPAAESSPLPTPAEATPTASSAAPSPTRTPPPARAPHKKKRSSKSPAPTPVTTSEVAVAVRSAGLPGLTTTTQPAPRTRVGIDTIFYTHPTTVSRTFTIRGTRVEITARPTSYSWSFGDGSGRTTTSPGKPYPHPTVTHRYKTEATRYVHVTTAYIVTCRIGTGAWQTLSGTFRSTGPSTKLVVIPKS